MLRTTVSLVGSNCVTSPGFHVPAVLRGDAGNASRRQLTVDTT